jgi:hypothetical protein
MLSKAEHPLAICLKILSTLGEPGRRVWELGKWYVGELVSAPDSLGQALYKKNRHPSTQAARLVYLKKAIAHLRKKALDKETWRELPVDFRTFVESPVYMNKPHVLWPKVMEEGEDINSGKYVECVLTGAIGVAKTTLALYTQAYQTYILACMGNPHEVFDLDPSSEILIVLQSVNKNAATDVDYRRLRDMILNAPYFFEHFPFQKDRESDMRFARNIIIKPVAGHDQAAIGQNVIGGLLDEINFMAMVENSKMSTDGGTYDQATSNYNSIARRRESRFMQLGQLPGMLCLVSSRKYPGQFTDKKEAEAKTNPRIKIYDRRIWELRPDRFSGERFDVFIGDATRKPRIIAPGDRVLDSERDKIIQIPVEYRHQFEGDILASLRDIAGVATQALHPFMMNTDAIAACFGKVRNVVSRGDCDFAATTVMLYPKRVLDPEWPRFCHLDLAITRDSCGFAVGHVPGFVPIKRGLLTEILPLVRMDVVLEIKPPKGGEILFSEVRRLIYALRRIGMPIKWVSSDNEMMSKDTLQLLSQQGFITGYKSMDVDTSGYDVTKQAIYDGRLEAPVHEKAQQEMTRLEIDQKTLQIDHPPGGSKDVADAIAGVTYGLTMQRETWTKHGVSLRDVPRSVIAAKTEKKNPDYVGNLRDERSKQRLAERMTEEAGVSISLRQ